MFWSRILIQPLGWSLDSDWPFASQQKCDQVFTAYITLFSADVQVLILKFNKLLSLRTLIMQFETYIYAHPIGNIEI